MCQAMETEAQGQAAGQVLLSGLKSVARPWRVEGNMSGAELTRKVRQQYKFSDYFPTGIAALHKVNI